ncbi:MAG TPA: helix-turn-helix domain-containing protein [Patescibacteria group bacterium]|nr:helix-turn-helix domain-containing protein [Patescibacteria group bacterium]
MEHYDKTTLTIPEVAQILRIGRGKAYELAKISFFPVIKIRRAYRIPANAFWKWYNSQMTTEI